MPEDAYPAHPSPEPDPLSNNPYLNREKCLLCQRDRTMDDESDSEGCTLTLVSNSQIYNMQYKPVIHRLI